MLSATIGASSAGIPAQAIAPKSAANEDEFASRAAPAKEAAKAPTEDAVPTIPATNSAPISVDAVTALQQVDTAEAPAEQRVVASAEDNQRAVSELGDTADEPVGVEAAAVQVEELEEEASQSRSNETTAIPVSEETDGAGRSARNPINLQI